MKNYTKTDYAINKKVEDAIVYKFADGSIKTITIDDFGGDAEVFRKWKAVSDKEYAESEIITRRSLDREVSIEELDGIENISSPSIEECADLTAYNTEFQREMDELLSGLSDKEKRRLYLIGIRGYSASKVAQIEGVDRRSIYKTMTKIKKIFQNALKNGSQNGTFFALSERIKFYERFIKKQTETE